MNPKFLIFILINAIVVKTENDSVEASYIDILPEEELARNTRRILAEAESRKVKKNESKALTESNIYFIDKVLKEEKAHIQEQLKNSPNKTKIQGGVNKRDATFESKSDKIQDRDSEKVDIEEDVETKVKINKLVDEALRNDFDNQSSNTEKLRERLGNEGEETNQDQKLQVNANDEAKDLKREQDQVMKKEDSSRKKSIDDETQITEDDKLQVKADDGVKDAKYMQHLEKKTEEKSIDEALRDDLKIDGNEDEESKNAKEQKLQFNDYAKKKELKYEKHQGKKVDDLLKAKSADSQSQEHIVNDRFEQLTIETDTTRKNTQSGESEGNFSSDVVKLNDLEKDFSKEALSVEINITDKADILRSKDVNQKPDKVVYDDSILRNMEQVRRLGSDSEEVLQSAYSQDKDQSGVGQTGEKKAGNSDMLSDNFKSKPDNTKTEMRKFELADPLLNGEAKLDKKGSLEKLQQKEFSREETDLHETDSTNGATSKIYKTNSSTQLAEESVQDIELSFKAAIKNDNMNNDYNNITITSSAMNATPLEKDKLTLVTSITNGAFKGIVNDSTQFSNENQKDKNVEENETDVTSVLNKSAVRSEEETNSSDNLKKIAIEEKEQAMKPNKDYFSTTTQLTPLTTAFIQQQDIETNKELSYEMESVEIEVKNEILKVFEATSSHDTTSQYDKNSDDDDGHNSRKKEYDLFQLMQRQNHFEERKVPTKKNPRFYPLLPRYYEASTQNLKSKTAKDKKTEYVVVHEYDPKYAYYNPRYRYEHKSKLGSSSQTQKQNDVIIHNYDPKYSVFNPKYIHFDDKRKFEIVLDENVERSDEYTMNYYKQYNINDKKSDEALGRNLLYYFPNTAKNLLRKRINRCRVSGDKFNKRSKKDCFFNQKQVYQESDSEKPKEKVPPNSDEYEDVYNAMLHKIPPLTHEKQVGSILSSFGHGAYVLKHKNKKSTTTPSPEKPKSVYEILFGDFDNADEEIEKSSLENDEKQENGNKEKKKDSLEPESQEKENQRKRKKKKKKFVRTGPSATPNYKAFNLYPEFVDEEPIKTKLQRLRTKYIFKTLNPNINKNRLNEEYKLINAPINAFTGKVRNGFNKMKSDVNTNRFNKGQKPDPLIVLTGSARSIEDDNHYIKTGNHQTLENFYTNQNLFAESSSEDDKNKQINKGNYYYGDSDDEFPQSKEDRKISKDFYEAFNIDDSNSLDEKTLKLKNSNTFKYIPKKALNYYPNEKDHKLLIVLLKNLFNKYNSYKINKKQPLHKVKRNNKEWETYLNV